jgi:hypothetical protein
MKKKCVFLPLFLALLGLGGLAAQNAVSTGAANLLTSTKPKGEVYVGIISFDQQSRDLTGGKPVLLDAAGLERLLGIVRNDYQLATASGTALYYAVHQALVTLTANESRLPDNLGTASIVTFTDGLDNASTSIALKTLEERSFGGQPLSAYQTFLDQQFGSDSRGNGRKIHGIDITAYSVGVMGNDIDLDNKGTFEKSIATLASMNKDPRITKEKNDNVINDMNDLRETFRNIAANLYTQTVDITFEVVTPTYPVGSKVRMTFDVAPGNNASAAAASSRKYLEGVVAVINGQYRLTNVSYSGGMSSMIPQGESVSGSLDGTVSYVFPSFLGYDPKTDPKPRQWNMGEGSQVWQVNSEYDANNDPVTKEESHPAVVYLVLDCSTSLSLTAVGQIRSAVEEFLGIMYTGDTGDTSQPVTAPRTTVAQGTPSASPAPASKPEVIRPEYLYISPGKRAVAMLLNPILGIGSSLILGDWGSGLTIGGFELLGGLLVAAGATSFENNEDDIGIMLAVGAIVFGTAVGLAFVMPWTYNPKAPATAGANPLSGLDISFGANRTGSIDRVSFSYTFRF